MHPRAAILACQPQWHLMPVSETVSSATQKATDRHIDYLCGCLNAKLMVSVDVGRGLISLNGILCGLT